MDEVVDKSTKGGNASTSVMSDDAQSTTCESKKQESKSIDNEESNKMDEVVNKSTKGGNTSTSVTSDDAQSTTCESKKQESKSNDNEESNERMKLLTNPLKVVMLVPVSQVMMPRVQPVIIRCKRTNQMTMKNLMKWMKLLTNPLKVVMLVPVSQVMMPRV